MATSGDGVNVSRAVGCGSQPVKSLCSSLAPKAAADRRIVAVLLCRAGSSRLYAKPLQRIGDRTILEHLIDQIRSVSRVSDIVLAISDGPENGGFVQLANKLGLEYVFGDEEDGLSRMIRAAEFANADIVFRVTTENPYIYLENIDQLIDRHLDEQADLTVCENLPDGAFVELINTAALKRAHAEGEPRHRSAWVTLYISEHPEIFKILRMLPPEELRRPDIRLTVDYPEDLIVVRAIYEAFEGRMPIPVPAIIKFLDEHPEINAVNGHIDAGVGRIWQ